MSVKKKEPSGCFSTEEGKRGNRSWPNTTADLDCSKPLPEAFNQLGHSLRLLKRQGLVALYERRLLFSGARPHWELVVLKVGKPTVIKGKSYPAREIYPRGEDWGKLGWTLVTLEDAELRYQGLVASLQEPEIEHTGPPLYSGSLPDHVRVADRCPKPVLEVTV